MIRFLICGSGNAREHATYRRMVSEGLRPDRDVAFVLYGPNALLAAEPGVHVVPSLAAAVQKSAELRPALVLLLSATEILTGVANRFEAQGLRVWGSLRQYNQLEGSKQFGKQCMQDWGIPTPWQWSFRRASDARQFLRSNWSSRDRFVVKADAMLDCPAHRVVVPRELDDAIDAVNRIERLYGGPYLIEECVSGSELSLHVLFSGEQFITLPWVRDYKRLLVGDKGPNTHGMGAVADGAPEPNTELRELEATIVRPTLRGMIDGGAREAGILYFGVILTAQGPRLIEFNVRSGNPEWVALLPLIRSSLAELIAASDSDRLDACRYASATDLKSVVTMLVGARYPAPHAQEGIPITGISTPVQEGFFGEQIVRLGCQYLTGPGRVLAIQSVGANWSQVRRIQRQRIDQISFAGMHYREDIGDLEASAADVMSHAQAFSWVANRSE